MTVIIHRYWTDSQIAKPETSALACKVASSFGHVLEWTDKSLPPRIVGMVDEKMSMVRSGNPLVLAKHRANMVRLLLLHDRGGIWIDHDVFLLSIPDVAPPWIAVSTDGYCSAAMRFNVGDNRLLAAFHTIAPAPSARECSGELHLAKRWRNSGINTVPFPFNANGEPVDPSAGPAWAVHTWHSSNTVRASKR